MNSFNKILYAQIIYDALEGKPYGIELLGRPPKYHPIQNPEEYFRGLSNERAAKWAEYQMYIAERFYEKTGLIATVNIDKNVLPLIDWKKHYQHVGLEFTDIQGLPSTSTIERIKRHQSDVKIILDDYNLKTICTKTGITLTQFDCVKIDKCIFQLDRLNNDTIELLDETIRTVKMNNGNIIAEGIETDEQLQFALTHGINIIQGYYYSKPALYQYVEYDILKILDKK